MTCLKEGKFIKAAIKLFHSKTGGLGNSVLGSELFIRCRSRLGKGAESKVKKSGGSSDYSSSQTES